MSPQSKGRFYLVLMLFSLVFRSQAATPPGNDSRADAILLPQGIGTVTNLTLAGATTEAGETSGQPSIWFRYESVGSLTARVSIANAPAGVTLEVYSQTPTTFTRIGGPGVSVAWRPVAGDLCYVMARGTNTAPFALNYTFGTLGLARPTPNERLNLSAPGPTTFEFTNGEPAIEFQSVTAWASKAGTSFIIGTGTNFPFSMVWTNDIAGGASVWIKAVTATGDERFGTTNAMTFKSRNDNFANAVMVTGDDGEFYAANVQTFAEAGEPSGGPGSIWYRWSPETSGLAQFDMGSTNAGQYLLFEGTTLTTLTNVPLTVVTNSSAQQANVKAGHTYYIAIYATTAAVRRFEYAITSMEFITPLAGAELLAPGVIDVALEGVPADTVSVDYIWGTNRFAIATNAPFSIKWTNGLTGPLSFKAVAHRADGTKAYARVRVANVLPGNDTAATAVILPSDLRYVSLHSSAYLATSSPGENGAGVWWKWKPDFAGYCVITIQEGTVGVTIQRPTGSSQIFNRPIPLTLTAGGQYAIILTDFYQGVGGFHWSIQNCPLVLPNISTNQFYAGSDIVVTPVAAGPTNDITLVEYVQNGVVLARSTEAPFAGRWTNALGAFNVEMRVTFADGMTLSGGTGAYTVRPANDDFAYAAVLPGDVMSQTIVIDQRDASRASDDPLGQVNRTVWWKWTPTRTARARLQIQNAGTGIGAGAFEGTHPTNLVTVASSFYNSSTRELLFNAVADRPCYIIIGGTFTAPLTWHLEQETLTLDGVTPRPNVFPFGPLNFTVRAVVEGDAFTQFDILRDGALVTTLAALSPSFVWPDAGKFALQVKGTNQDGTVRSSFPLELTVRPPNDNRDDATEFPASLSAAVEVRTSFQFAGLESNQGEYYFGGPDASLWWKWTPQFSSRTTITALEGSMTFFPRVSTNATFDQYDTLLKQTATEWEFFPQAGQTYYISLIGYQWGSKILWRLNQETLRLDVSQHNVPITIKAIDANTNETFSALSLFVNGVAETELAPPDFATTWTTNTPGRYLFAAIGTNDLGVVRTTETVEYWVGPTNNYFADAAELARTATSWRGVGNVGGSSIEPGEALWKTNFAGSIWYRWTAPFDGLAHLVFSAGAADLNTRASLYEGSGIDDLRRLTPTLITNGLVTPVTQGSIYYIAVATTTRADEPIAFEIIEPPVNDNLANAIVLNAMAGTFSGTTRASSNEEAEKPFLSTTFAPGSVWYQLTAQETGNLQFVIDASASDVGVSAFYGTNWTNVIMHAALAVIRPGNGYTIFRVVKGETYSISFASAGGPFTARTMFFATAGPTNDFRRSATFLSGTNVSIGGTVRNSTRELQEPSGYEGTVWYRWVAPARGKLHYSIEEAEPAWPPLTLTGYLGIFNGANDSVVNEGDAFDFMVGLPGLRSIAASPLFTLHIDLDVFKPAPANDMFANRFQINVRDYAIATTSDGASVEANEPGAGFGRTSWWELVPETNGVALIEMTGGDAALVNTYMGNTLESLQLVTSTNTAIVPLTNGVPLQIQVEAWSPLNFDLRVKTFYGRPANDDFAYSTELVGTNVTASGANFLATKEAGEPALPMARKGKSIWWSWCSTNVGDTTFRVSAYVPVAAAIFTGVQLDRLTRLWTAEGADLTKRIHATEQTVYHLLVDSTTDVDGEITVEINQDVLPLTPNDKIWKPVFLIGGSATARASNLGATRELDEPVIFSTDRKSTWFDWRGVGGNSSVTASAFGIPELELAVYEGTAFENLKLLAKGTNQVKLLSDGSKRYRISVESRVDQSADIEVNAASGQTWGTYPAAQNLIKNGSFETAGPAFWFLDGSVGGHINEVGAEGRNWLTLGAARIWQDVATVPGHSYELRFAMNIDQANLPTSWITIKFAGNGPGWTQITPLNDFPWAYARYVFTATNELSRVEIGHSEALMGLDAVSLVDLSAPPTLAAAAPNVTVFAGGDAAFLPIIHGAEPMRYQWFFGSEPLTGKTNQSLFLPDVAAGQQGDYTLVASNDFGAITTTADLRVEAPEAPVILLQPAGQRIAEGNFFALSIIAAGTSPMKYQWSRNSLPIAGATNRSLVFESVTAADAGGYTVRVSNDAGASVSIPANVMVGPAEVDSGIIYFVNYDLMFGVRAPVFDVDGKTALAGTNFLMQLYAGEAIESMRAFGSAQRFSTGFAAGRIRNSIVHLSGFTNDSTILVQYRAWDATRGATYEEARAAGGRFGASQAIPMRVTGPFAEEVPYEIQSFSLRAGMNEFAIGRLEAVSRGARGDVILRLDGAAGFRYLVEKKLGDADWLPFKVVTLTTSAIEVLDDAAGEAAFYRTRILE